MTRDEERFGPFRSLPGELAGVDLEAAAQDRRGRLARLLVGLGTLSPEQQALVRQRHPDIFTRAAWAPLSDDIKRLWAQERLQQLIPPPPPEDERPPANAPEAPPPQWWEGHMLSMHPSRQSPWDEPVALVGGSPRSVVTPSWEPSGRVPPEWRSSRRSRR